jgi:hypothetical protein
MKKIKLLITSLLLFTSFSCIPLAQASNKNNIQNNQDELSIVKSSFKDKVNSDSRSLKTNLPKPIKGNSEDTKDYTYHGEFIPETKIDIKKTDSIMSPYIGTAIYYINWYSNGKFVSKQYILAEYAYQDDQWILKSAKRDTGYGYNEDAEELQWVSSLFR